MAWAGLTMLGVPVPAAGRKATSPWAPAPGEKQQSDSRPAPPALAAQQCWKGKSLSPYQRADLVIEQMTME